MIKISHIDDDQLRIAYDNLYKMRPIRHLDSFYLWIYRLLDVSSGQSYLDVACGQARLVEIGVGNNVQTFGTDYSFSALSASKSKSRLFVSNGEHLPIKSGSIDRLSNIGSLEHYVNIENGAKEMARLLSPEGLALIFVPNTFSILATVLYAFHTGKILDDGQPIQRYNTRIGWQNLLEANGFKILDVRKYERETPLNLPDLIHYLKRPKELAHLILSPLIPLNLSNSFVFLCKRREDF